MSEKTCKLTLNELQALPKIVHHEHYDCSIRPEHVLSDGTRLDLKIPSRFKHAWRTASNPTQKKLAVMNYQSWLQGHARGSLTNYLEILWDQVLPTLQSGDNIYNTAKQRIEDAIHDGIIFLKLRFAPQLHMRNGLTIQQVIDPLQQAAREAQFPVCLAICALRHENGRMARRLADAVIRNPYVTTFDLAGDESKFPGVLDWWAKQAMRVTMKDSWLAFEGRPDGEVKEVACHIGEAASITAEDRIKLKALRCKETAHGINGDSDSLCTVCMISNLVTHMVKNPESHPIDKMYRAGKAVNIDPDGTLLTGADTTDNYMLIHKTFGWQLEDFLACNLMGLKHAPVVEPEKKMLKNQLFEGYKTAGLTISKIEKIAARIARK